MPPLIRIPVYRPSLSGSERQNVLECLDTTWISSKGRFISDFEAAFCRYTGSAYAATVSNGTVALHVALAALGIGPGDEVIVPTLTYVASANAVCYTGARPVFVDSLRDTWQIDPHDVARKVTSRTKALMPVHLYGHPCNLDPLLAIARAHRLSIIEDCAEAIGSRYKSHHVGTSCDIATYSFYGNKTVTTGEGGMVATNDRRLHERVMLLKGQGLAAGRDYWHEVMGYNYRMTNICAAIGLAQLERVENFIERKRAVARWYQEGLEGLPVELQDEVGDVRHTYWMVSLLARSAEQCDALRRHLAQSGIETRPVFSPVHTMPMYARPGERHPVAEDLAQRGMNLPSWPDLERATIMEICECIAGYFRNA